MSTSTQFIRSNRCVVTLRSHEAGGGLAPSPSSRSPTTTPTSTSGTPASPPSTDVVITKEYEFPLSLRVLATDPDVMAMAKPKAPGTGGASTSALNTSALIAAYVNGVATSLATVCQVHRVNISPIFLDSEEGWSIYRRSLVFVMGMAALQEFGKEWKVTLEHYSGGSGYMCSVCGGKSVPPADIARLRTAMRKIISSSLDISEVLLSYEEALAYFESTGRDYSIQLLQTENNNCVKCSLCADYMALDLRALVSNTGILLDFDLGESDYGFVLRFPSKKTRSLSPCFIDDKLMNGIFREYNDWGRTIKVGCVGELNKQVVANKGKHVVAMCEALHNQKIVQIAVQIAARTTHPKVILIAGPSASGKTTFACKLSTQLAILGIPAITMTIDNYFVPRVETPKDENGKWDFECLEAIRINYLNEHLLALFRGEEIDSPIYDFKAGAAMQNKSIPMQLPPNGVIIMEGIHCMNDKLTPLVPAELKFKIFLAPLSQINIDEYNFMSHSLARVMRRIVRDYNHRGYSAQQTLARWQSVSAGEEKHIFPFMSSADVVCNTSLDYEPAVLKQYVLPLLQSVNPNMEVYNVARNLMRILNTFIAIPHDSVPPSSLLREFIGGSFFGAE